MGSSCSRTIQTDYDTFIEHYQKRNIEMLNKFFRTLGPIKIYLYVSKAVKQKDITQAHHENMPIEFLYFIAAIFLSNFQLPNGPNMPELHRLSLVYGEVLSTYYADLISNLRDDVRPLFDNTNYPSIHNSLFYQITRYYEKGQHLSQTLASSSSSSIQQPFLKTCPNLSR